MVLKLFAFVGFELVGPVFGPPEMLSKAGADIDRQLDKCSGPPLLHALMAGQVPGFAGSPPVRGAPLPGIPGIYQLKYQ